MGGSSSKSSSKPVDVTPGAFKDLQQPFANVVAAALPGIPQGTQRIVEGYKGPTTSPLTTGEEQALGQVQSLTQGQTPFQQAPPTPVYGAAGAGSDVTNALLGGTAMSGLTPQMTSQFVGGLGLQNQNMQNLGTILGLQGGPFQGVVPQGFNNAPLNEFQAGVAGASQTGAFGGDANNPFLQSYIQAAQRPTQQALEETLSRTLPGRFTQAGQFVQPGSSSAFDRAAAIATRGAADALGDISTNISYQALEQARGREAESLGAELARRGQQGLQTQALGAQGGLQAQQLTADAIRQSQALGAQGGLQTQALTAQAQQSQLDRALQSLGIGSQLATDQQGRALTGAQTDLTGAQQQQIGSGVESQQIQNAIANLQAQALPRLIQDLGVERGIEAFNNNVNALLSSMGIAAGVTRPVVAQEGKSSSKGFSL